MTGRLVAFIVIVVLLVVAVSLLGSASEERSGFVGQYSTYSAAPRGSRALMELSERVGLEPQVLVHDFATLPEEGTIVSVMPRGGAGGGFFAMLFSAFGPYTEKETETVIDWVGSGNTFVLFYDKDLELLDEMGIEVIVARDAGDQNKKDGESDVWPPATEGATLGLRDLVPFTGVERLEVEGDAPGLIMDSFVEDIDDSDAVRIEGFTPLVRREDGTLVAAEVRYGAGRFVFVSAPFVATNTGIGREDNAVFLVRLLGRDGRGLYFDEFHHGFAHQRGLSSYLRDSSLWIAACQLLFVLALLGWRVSNRFGSPLSFFEDEYRGSGDYVRAMSLIYQRGKHDRHAISVMLDDLDRVLAERYRLPRELSGEKLLARIGELGHGELVERIRGVRGEALHTISQEKRRPKAILAAAGRLASLIKELGSR